MCKLIAIKMRGFVNDRVETGVTRTDLDTSSTHQMVTAHQSTESLYCPPILGRCHERYLLAVVASASGAQPKGPQVMRGLGPRKGRDRAPTDHCTISQSRVGGLAREPGNLPGQ